MYICLGPGCYMSKSNRESRNKHAILPSTEGLHKLCVEKER
jgi:hypothetical protein